MEEKKKALAGSCNFAGMRPAMADLPYPQIQVWGRNQAYANLLTIDYYQPLLSILIMKTAFPMKIVLWQRQF